jgi:beta-N-acetylhexosaminidase
MADSHLELPIVDTDIETLKKTDFLPFKNLNDQKFAMTAHILYKAIDSKNCATISKNAIDLIRNDIGFQNILMTDDLSMKALSLDFATRTKKALDAGCDLILHCNGDINEMNAINSALPIINDNFWQRFTK